MRKALAIAVIAAATATSACGKNRAEDGGPTISRNYQVGAFTQIEVAGPYDVDVRTGAHPSVSASGPEKLLERTVVEVKDGKLVIRPEKQKGMFNFGWSSHGKAKLSVTVQQLNGATIAGSGDIRVNDVRGDKFEGTVAGSGSLDVAALDVKELKFAIAGSGEAKAGKGRAQTAKFDIAGSGDIDARGVQTQDAAVSIAGSGGVSAHATGTADVSIMGSGDVEVTGGAKCSVSKAGSGNVRCS